MAARSWLPCVHLKLMTCSRQLGEAWLSSSEGQAMKGLDEGINALCSSGWTADTQQRPSNWRTPKQVMLSLPQPRFTRQICPLLGLDSKDWIHADELVNNSVLHLNHVFYSTGRYAF